MTISATRTHLKLAASFTALGFLLAACGGSEPEPVEEPTPSEETAAEETMAAEETAEENAPMPEGVDYSVAESGTYALDKGHAYIVFSYNHLGFSNPMVRWGDWEANLNWDSDNPENSTLDAVIDATSVDTGVPDFNDHLNSADFFDTAEYPQITFVTSSLEMTGADAGTVSGDLTIKDTTQPVTLDVMLNKADYNADNGTYKLGFSGRTTVLRSDFGLDAYVPNVSDEVDIIVEAEFTKAEE